MLAYRTELPLVAFLLALPLAGLSGCGASNGGIEKVIVQGTVTFDEAPIANGEIRFYPTAGTHGPVSGGPIKDGKYIARGGGGVPVGKHRVDIRAFRPNPRYKGNPEGGPIVQYLPNKYNAKSTLILTVDRQDKNHDFVLTSN